MTSTSASSIQKNYKYDVFLSFRGEDTRKGFVDHLYHAFKQKSIDTYRDDEKIKKGERIDEQLIKSIEESNFYIIIFSKNYVSSSWCLDELVKIMQCEKTKGHTAYPVFYDVEPTDVRNQSGVVGKAFAKHIEDKYVGKWQEALREAANLAGWELKNTYDGHEAMLIQELVKEISLELHVTNLSCNGKLVGMKKRVKYVISSLEMDIGDFRMIGIKGIGGGGKTTLVKAVFDQISHLYDGSSFVENVREISTSSLGGLRSLQIKILSDVLKNPHITVNGVSDLKGMMKKMVCSRKVLVILDDVDHIDQLEALVGEPNWFKPGSRVIITTRDKQVLVAHGVPENFILDVNLLSHEEANCLFSRYAFGGEHPNHGLEMLSDQFVSYAAGLPLTIKVLGAFLCRKDELEWTDALERLKKIPLKETQKILELSYNSLEEDYKEIFLDVACILKGWEKEKAIRVLESCGFHARTGLKVLEQKSIITVSDKGILSIHDHIEEMGKNIVRRLHPNKPYKHSRLWITEEVNDILVEDKGTEKTICISVGKVDPIILMKGLRKMKKLRLLRVAGERDSRADISEDSLYLPDCLQYLHWDGYPFTCLPKSFQASNLVGLKLAYSSIDQLWERGERKDLKKLRFVDLYNCELRILDMGLALNLERLNLKLCGNLYELHMPIKSFNLKFLSLDSCRLYNVDLSWAQNLDTLHIKNCERLEELHMPVKSFRLKILSFFTCGLNTLDLSQARNLNTLDIDTCENLVELHMPVESPCLKHLKLKKTKLRSLNLKSALNLKNLDVALCETLEELHMPVEIFELESVMLIGSKLRTLDLMGAHNLVSLLVRRCNLVELHMPFEIVKLESIKLRGTNLSTLDLSMAQNLVSLNVGGGAYLDELHMPVGKVKLESVTLQYIKMRALDLSGAHNLISLKVDQCYNLVELHMPVEMAKLESVELRGFIYLKALNLSGAQNLISLKVNKCRNLVELHMPVKNATLKFVELRYCKLGTLDFTSVQNLYCLTLYECEYLLESNMTFDCLTLHTLRLGSDEIKTLNLKAALNLEYLSLECCNLAEIQAPIRCLKDQVKIKADGNRCHRLNPFLVNQGSPMLLIELRLTASSSDTACELHPDNNLNVLSFRCVYKEPPSSLKGNPEKVIFVNLRTCRNLASILRSSCNFYFLKKLALQGDISEVPIEVEHLECLEELKLKLRKTERLQDSICMLKQLKSLKLESCWFLRQLPADLDRLECLEELCLRDCTSLQDIPNSICEMRRLKHLDLSGCVLVKKLPTEIGCLECLEELNIKDTSITELPQSMFQLKDLHIITS